MVITYTDEQSANIDVLIRAKPINGGVRYKDSDDLDDIFNIAITTSEDSSDSNWFIRQLEPGLTRDKLIDYLIEDLDSEVKAFLENCGAVKKHNEVLVAVVLEQ